LVACESPTYTNGSATAMSYEADILEVPVDDEGMQVEVLEEHTARTGRPPKVIYTIPTFQNPAGVTMSLPRRERLLSFAHRHRSVIIEDNPYGMLRFSGESLPALSDLSPTDPLIFGVRTFPRSATSPSTPSRRWTPAHPCPTSTSSPNGCPKAAPSPTSRSCARPTGSGS